MIILHLSIAETFIWGVIWVVAFGKFLCYVSFVMYWHFNFFAALFLELVMNMPFLVENFWSSWFNDFDSNNILMKWFLFFSYSSKYLISSSKWLVNSFTYSFTQTLTKLDALLSKAGVSILSGSDSHFFDHIYPQLNQYHLHFPNTSHNQIRCNSVI